MNWIKVLPQDGLPDGHRRVVEVGGRPVLLASHKGQIYAMDNLCPHMGAALADGQIREDGTIVCPRHHSAFDLRTGVVMEWTPWPPGVGRVLGSLSKEKPLSVYATRIDEAGIWVALDSGD